MIGNIFYKILFYFLEIAFVENSGRSYPVFGNHQSAKGLLFLPEVSKLYLIEEGRKSIMHFGLCQTQDTKT